MTRTLEEAAAELLVAQDDWVNDEDIGHRRAMDNIDACLSVTILSYEEAVKSYLRDRGIGIDKTGKLRFHAHRLITRPSPDHAGLAENKWRCHNCKSVTAQPFCPERCPACHCSSFSPVAALSNPSPVRADRDGVAKALAETAGATWPQDANRYREYARAALRETDMPASQNQTAIEVVQSFIDCQLEARNSDKHQLLCNVRDAIVAATQEEAEASNRVQF
ncbi:hypothetical protein [Parasphingorhabdus sp.]|uniref:hypothetical protein n=1 Tax=Parasphingorhabdus sp. TaxID=2709688 RepID=UPI003A910BED